MSSIIAYCHMFIITFCDLQCNYNASIHGLKHALTPTLTNTHTHVRTHTNTHNTHKHARTPKRTQHLHTHNTHTQHTHTHTHLYCPLHIYLTQGSHALIKEGVKQQQQITYHTASTQMVTGMPQLNSNQHTNQRIMKAQYQ